jgi:hypothetical protein
MSEFLVLHALAVKGFASAAEVGRFARLDEAVAADALARAAADGDAVFRDGKISAWALTAGGRARHRDLLAEERAAVDRAPVLRGYERFLSLDAEVKQLCTTWQRDGRSAALLDDLGRIHAEAAAVIAGAAVALPRLAAYRARLDRAVERVRAGDDTALTRPLTGSFHDVWMELHEDLLRTLDLER